MIIKYTGRYRADYLQKTSSSKYRANNTTLINKTTIKSTISNSKSQSSVPRIFTVFIMFILGCSILCKQPTQMLRKRMSFENVSAREPQSVGIMSGEDREERRSTTSGVDKLAKKTIKPPYEDHSSSPSQFSFDVGDSSSLNQPDEEEEDDDFYVKNPVDTRMPDFDVKDSDFNDFDDHQVYNTDSFYKPKSAKEKRSSTKSEHEKIADSINIVEPGKVGDKVSSIEKPLKPPESKKEGSLIGETGHINQGTVAQESYLPSLPECILALRSGICLNYNMIEWAVRRARVELDYERPSSSSLNSAELSEATINAVGELTETTTRILAHSLRMDWQEISFSLEQVDMSRTSLWSSCPAVFRSPPSCRLITRYRTHNGQCNNPVAGHIGSSNMPFVRILPPDYSDGVGAPRSSTFSGALLPPARLVALSLHPDVDNPNGRHSVLYMAWGQLLNHDLSMASGARAGTGHEDSCCQRNRQRVCMPIEIGANDPLYSQYGIRCHEFKRSLAGLRPGCTLGPRTQINTVTSFVDASFVYGSSRSMSATLRRNNRGMLETWNYFGTNRLQALLPPQLDNPDEECVGRRNDGRFCFLSGDARTNQQIQLVALHTVHTRQHNRIAGALSRLNPHWTDNKVYHEARHIHIAMVQHILLNEFLPALLGPTLCAKYNLTESSAGTYWDHYDGTINPGISQAFSAAAFRQGHTTVPSQVFRFNFLHEPTRMYQLRELFRQPWPLYEPGAMDEFLLGTVDAPAASFDPFISSDLSGHLLEVPEEPVGLDLTAINIQRGRDQGVPGYNAFRVWCGLGKAKSFGDLNGIMSNRSTVVMSQLYETVDDIDLFTGGISEFPLDGAQVGPTFACIIGRQFYQLRAGDRYWFESSMGPQTFSIAQLESIKQVTLARILCANSDNIQTIQLSALNLPHPVLNPRVLCASIPDLDITLWYDPFNRPPQDG